MQEHLLRRKPKNQQLENRGTVLFLYSRLPDYFYRCIQYFVNNYPYKAVVIRYRDDPDTRYSFPDDSNIGMHYLDTLDVEKFVRDIDPVAIVQSGWASKIYNKVTATYVKDIPTIMAMDNPWMSSFRQKILSNVGRWYLHGIFNTVWVTGRSQFEYAGRLGYNSNQIHQGLYAADTEKFYRIQDDVIESRTRKFPRSVVFVGRLVEYKQPHVLAEVFSEIVANDHSGWELILAGEGPLKEAIRQKGYPRVKVVDFISPSDLPEFYKTSGIFCLPSISEHWGVAVQEAAAAGLPLLLSDTVEAGTEFLIHGYNGFSHKSGNRLSLKNNLRNLLSATDQELLDMGNNSRMLSSKVDQRTWAAVLNSILINE
jgi:glycosyltransferase involved in cell wall biosynthesis